MMRRTDKRTRGGRSRRKFVWIFGGIATVCALLYWEQAAVLYVLSTLAVCGLMLVVAFANLEKKDKELHQQATIDREKKRSNDSAERAQLENEAA